MMAPVPADVVEHSPLSVDVVVDQVPNIAKYLIKAVAPVVQQAGGSASKRARHA
jgi:hypothetical protein